jgi:glucosylceramidase
MKDKRLFRTHFRHLFLAIPFCCLLAAGCGGGGSPATSATTPTAAAPTLNPGTGTYISAQTVTIADATTGATIYYTLDGTTPSTSSARFTAPLTISSTTTVNAIAVATGYNSSAVASATYTVNLPAAATPTFSVTAGTYTAVQIVTLSDTAPGAAIYYTLDGTTPTISSAKYSSPLSISSTTTVNAIAVATGYNNSAVASAIYTINLPLAATPTFSPAPGTFTATQTVTLSDTTASTTIYFTTDGTTPTISSTRYTVPFTVPTTSTVKAIAAAPGMGNSTVASGTYTITAITTSVNVVLSTHDQISLMAPQSPVAFATNPASTNQIIVDESQTYQTMDGFGAAFTDSAAYLLETVVPVSAQSSALSDLFTRTGSGIGLSFMRLPMGTTDLARTEYTFDDSPSPDVPLSNFSINHDKPYIMPLVTSARTLNPSMKIMANPWSPPAWMKDSNSINGGHLLPSMYTPFANYFVKYLQAYSAAGININFISLQNEPLYNTYGYPAMYMDAATQTTVMRDFVLPALTATGLSTQIFAYDHNWDGASYPQQILQDSTLYASPFVAGTAWHGYGGVPGFTAAVQNLYPNKGMWETEHSGGTFTSDQFSTDFMEITDVLRNSSKGYIKWSLALDENHGPNLTQIGLMGCNICTGIVTVNSTTGAVTRNIDYYTLGHYSKYVLPGATRVYSSNGVFTNSVAFLNPDGSKALIVYNNSSNSQTFQVEWGTKSFSYTLPGLAAATFAWTGNQDTVAPLIATSEIQGSDYSSQFGLADEKTGDASGAYDLGYVNNNAYATYNNVSFGPTSPTKVLVRSASAGNGGTLEFHLDSRTGTLLGTATLAVTGGYQTYQTVPTTLTSSVTGTHTLYIVFHGTGAIANVNWFQFQ